MAKALTAGATPARVAKATKAKRRPKPKAAGRAARERAHLALVRRLAAFVMEAEELAENPPDAVPDFGKYEWEVLHEAAFQVEVWLQHVSMAWARADAGSAD